MQNQVASGSMYPIFWQQIDPITVWVIKFLIDPITVHRVQGSIIKFLTDQITEICTDLYHNNWNLANAVIISVILLSFIIAISDVYNDSFIKTLVTQLHMS